MPHWAPLGAIRIDDDDDDNLQEHVSKPVSIACHV